MSNISRLRDMLCLPALALREAVGELRRRQGHRRRLGRRRGRDAPLRPEGHGPLGGQQLARAESKAGRDDGAARAELHSERRGADLGSANRALRVGARRGARRRAVEAADVVAPRLQLQRRRGAGKEQEARDRHLRASLRVVGKNFGANYLTQSLSASREGDGAASDPARAASRAASRRLVPGRCLGGSGEVPNGNVRGKTICRSPVPR